MEKAKAQGLRWIKRRKGKLEPVWVADPKAVRDGYTPKTVNLSYIADHAEQLVAKCAVLQADLTLWRTGYQRDLAVFDGRVATILDKYERDPESPYHSLRPGSLKPYKHYLPHISKEIGQRRVDSITGIDIFRWHRLWSSDGQHIAAAAMKRAILAAAVSYGVMCRLPGCAEFLAVIKETNKKLPQPKRREIVITAEQVAAARASAHANNRPAWALAYALAYETTLRLWDVIGQWVPMETPGVSTVVDPRRGTKWFGLRWDAINENLVLRYTPSKTSGKTGKTVTYPLTMAPMVLEELEHWPKRTGPVIVASNGLPPLADSFRDGWKVDRKAAGIASSAWARDLRASGITEARAGDAALDDAAMVAGHSGTRTTSAVYDRANLAAAERFAQARIKQREQSANTDTNTQ